MHRHFDGVNHSVKMDRSKKSILVPEVNHHKSAKKTFCHCKK